MKLKLNVENVPNEKIFIDFLKYMRCLTTCRDLYIEEFDGSYLDSLVEYLPRHISYMHIKFAKTFEGF